MNKFYYIGFQLFRGSLDSLSSPSSPLQYGSSFDSPQPVATMQVALVEALARTPTAAATRTQRQGKADQHPLSGLAEMVNVVSPPAGHATRVRANGEKEEGRGASAGEAVKMRENEEEEEEEDIDSDILITDEENDTESGFLSQI